MRSSSDIGRRVGYALVGLVKTVLFYGVFWILAVVLSSLVGTSRMVYFALFSLKEFGIDDPQIVAGAISQALISWLLLLLFLTFLIYPIYYFLRSKIKLLALLTIVGLAIIIPTVDTIFIKVDLLGVFIKFVGTGVFIIVGAELPYVLSRRQRLKSTLTITVNTFD